VAHTTLSLTQNRVFCGASAHCKEKHRIGKAKGKGAVSRTTELLAKYQHSSASLNIGFEVHEAA